jgi:hypothetical protein
MALRKIQRQAGENNNSNEAVRSITTIGKKIEEVACDLLNFFNGKDYYNQIILSLS